MDKYSKHTLYLHIDMDFNLIDKAHLQSAVLSGQIDEIEFVSAVYGIRAHFIVNKELFAGNLEKVYRALQFYRAKTKEFLKKNELSKNLVVNDVVKITSENIYIMLIHDDSICYEGSPKEIEDNKHIVNNISVAGNNLLIDFK
ncbi:hypothetical protein [Streptococcus mutans]|uniref:hypothetical protein n=1 Tax=Streptococcus mutans TaxID=1309 RepID=UPI0028ED467C|nr:hypothetical protein [Streptococcus mutans]MDT9502462.1 hypothetical protein [Streptococcus mutans]